MAGFQVVYARQPARTSWVSAVPEIGSHAASTQLTIENPLDS